MLLSPLIVLVVVGVGMYVFFAPLGESFVATTVAAMLQGFNWNLVRSSLSLGQNSVTTFFHLTLLVFTPGVMSGALFAVATSFGEMVVRLSLAGTEQTTLPREMFTGIRDNISPSVGALATILMVFSTCLLLALKLLRGELLNERWSESACTSLPVFGRQHRPSAS
ncbi:hypothetical protein WS70_22805 [Burkholderia mayonis]|uniref:ABC transmembrane type-1 domain-containing protein n=1 Tax=Burkholderia mayonis TaxID=1385591 RepID=A0A1B4FLT4_9BURK|nr:hypothetical protein WS70_22805 [Burkholderia mayonis]KVE40916.1 hypothetical protein WS70_16030 [Burkholderia mayonis]